MKKAITLLTFIVLLICSFFIGVTAYAEQKSIDWINVEYGENYYLEKDLPEGVKGCSYPIPNCDLVDNNGDKVNGMQIFVYDPDNQLVAQENGRFKTEKSGNYKIVYQGEYLSLYTEKTIDIYVVENLSLSYQISEEVKSEYYTGEFILLTGKAVGGVGNVNVCFSAMCGQDEYVVSDFGGGAYFVPPVAGEYTVKVSLIDYVNQEYETSIPITIVDSDSPIMEQPSIQPINRVGQKVCLPTVSAVLYKNGNSFIVPVKVCLDGQDISSTMQYVAEEGEHVITYEAFNLDGTESVKYSYPITVIDAGDSTKYNDNYKYINNYLLLDGFDTVFENGCNLIAKLGIEDASATFSSKISSKMLTFSFDVVAGKSKFSAIELTLTDSRISTERVVIDFVKNGNSSAVYINGKYCDNIDYSFDLDLEIEDIALSIDSLTGVVSVGAEKIGKIDTYDNGRLFTGFSSNSCYATISAKGISGDCGLNISKIGGMGINTRTTEKSNPLFNYNDGISDTIIAEINQNVELPYLKAYDPLDEYVTIKLVVYDPNGSVVYDDVMSQSVSIKIDKYGFYSAMYSATDIAGNSTRRYISINVIDREFPTLRVDFSDRTVKVGETISLPKPTYSDNCPDGLVCFISVVSENSQHESIIKETYTFDKEGVYTVKYVAMDAMGNYAMKEFTVICKG